MSAARRFLVLLDIALMLAWITMAIVVYDRLPASIPTHFGPSGAADAFADRSIGSWFALTTIGVCVTSMVLGLAHIAHRRPAMYNVPGKEEMLSLPQDARRPFVEQLAMFMTVVATGVMLLFAAIQFDMWRVATTDQRGLSAVSWSVMGVFFCGMLLGLPVWLMRFQRGVSAAHRTLAAGARRGL